ncbi:MAG: ExeA family protein [Limnochordia bacterium]
MFESHFGLTRTPFSREIPAHSLFLTRNHRGALSRLHYTAQRRQVMILIGDSGVGKSTVLRRLKHELDPTSYEALLDRYQIHRRTPVLLLDEAQEMPDELLDAVRGLLNYDCDAFSPFALVLVGTRRLANRIEQQRHAAPAGRIHMPFHLSAFTPQETAEYVQHHLQVAGTQRPIYTEPALKRLHQTSNGNARRVNRIATLCLLSAALTKQDLIDDELVSQVVASELGEEAQ